MRTSKGSIMRTLQLMSSCSKGYLYRCHLAPLSSSGRWLHSSRFPLYSEEDHSTPKNESKPDASLPTTTGRFAEAFDKFTGNESFVKLLRNSEFIKMGDPAGKIVEGKIYHIVGDDLYIDFGGKFPCVCPRPQKNGDLYTLGRKVRIRIHELELSTRFIGAKQDLSILEADCTLLGLASPKLDGGESRN